MVSTIGTLLDRLQGLVSKGFLLAGFLPAAIFLALNLGLIYLVFRDARPSMNHFFGLSASDQALYWLAGILFSFILGIAFWSLNSWFRQFLEGRYLPASLRRLEKIQYRELEAYEKKISETLEPVSLFREDAGRIDALIWFLKEMRMAGNEEPQNELSAELKDKFAMLKGSQGDWEPISYQEIKDFFFLLADDLRTKPADRIKELDEIHQEFFKLFSYAQNRQESFYNRALSEKRFRFPENTANLGPTRMANFNEVHREYGLNYYGLDIEWFWLRLLKSVRADASFSPILEEAKTQLDFTVATTMIFGMLTVTWIPLSLVFAASITPYITVAALGVPLVFIFYNISVQNYRTFVEAVRSAVDLHRFELLKLLHVELPADSKQEKEIWDKLMRWGFDNSQPITYRHDGVKPAGNDSKPDN